MFNKNIIKSLVEKFAVGIIGFGLVLGGASLIPAFASAKGLQGNFNVNVKAGNNNQSDHSKTKVQNHNDADFGFGLGLGLGHLNIDMTKTTSGQDQSSIKEIIKPAQTSFRQAVTSANGTYHTAKKTAQTQLKASITANTSQADRITAVKTYLSSVLTAFHTRGVAIEAAFQAFINTNFNVNHTPIANAQSVSLSKNSSVAITLTGSDPEASGLTFSVVGSPTHGTLSGTTPNLTYTPVANFTGTDSFTFKVNDGSLDSTLTTVSITVNP